LLFTSVFAPVAVINVDDPHGRLLADAVADRAGTDSMRVVEITLDDVDQLVVESDRHSYRWRGHDIDVPLGGSFNVANSMLALSMVAELDVDLDRAIAGLSTLAPVPGRFETVDSAYARERGITVIIDYAHTPDGLAQLLESARPLTTGRLIAVFGCAGRRDREKRPVMGEIAARLADIALATSDNPRGEDPTEIINDVIAGVAEQYRSRVISEPDRRIAIRRGVALAERGDMVVIAGKGHENTQDLGDTVIDFDDRTVACEELAAAPSIVGEGSP
jgi:UDP-N-acetylmuramoyl-L-alanyl-D-glutamate--2,6-diaminopimelate ligase